MRGIILFIKLTDYPTDWETNQHNGPHYYDNNGPNWETSDFDGTDLFVDKRPYSCCLKRCVSLIDESIDSVCKVCDSVIYKVDAIANSAVCKVQ